MAKAWFFRGGAANPQGVESAAHGAPTPRSAHVGRVVGILLAGWSLLAAGSFLWNLQSLEHGAERLAHEAATDRIERTVGLIKFLLARGGVYLPVDEVVRPSSYLEGLRDRDVSLPSGGKLTLVPGPYLLHLIGEETENPAAAGTRLTSLEPLDPENAPDPWERAALEAFESGEHEVAEVVREGSTDYYRVIRSLPTENACLRCHASQGYKVGDVRGGISVRVAMAPYAAAAAQHFEDMSSAQFMVWLAGVIGLLGSGVHLRRRAQQSEEVASELAESERRFRLFYKEAPVAYLELDGAGTILETNAAWSQLLGYTQQESLGRPLADFLRNESVAGRGEQVSSSQRISRGDSVDLELRCKDGESAYVSVYSRIGHDPTGEFHTLRCAIHDVTQRKLNEQRAREMNRELEDRVAQRTAELSKVNGELQAFAYSVSHDLRSPLRVIDGFARLVLEDGGKRLDDDNRARLERVLSGIGRLSDIVDGLLSLSRLGRKEMLYESIDPGSIVAEVCEELEPQWNGRRVDTIVGALPGLRADPRLVRQLYFNLISNAAKFTRDREIARIEIGAVTEGDEAVYFVKDNGVGFDNNCSDEVFGAFKRLHRAEDFEGTGIGLAIVERIVHRHGGRIWAEARENAGASFFFTLS